MSAPVLYDHILSCNNSSIAIYVIKLSIKSFSNRPFQLFFVILNEPLNETRSIYIKTFTICHSTTETIKLSETIPNQFYYNTITTSLIRYSTIVRSGVCRRKKKSEWEKSVNLLVSCQKEPESQDRMCVQFTHFSGLERKPLQTSLVTTNPSFHSTNLAFSIPQYLS